MEETIRKRINLLTHLAMADGKFHKSERDLIDSLLVRHGIKAKDAPVHDEEESPFFGIQNIHDKEELIYLALKLMKADGEIHIDEVAFCKTMLLKLRFSPTVVDQYARQELPELREFVNELQDFKRL